MPSKTHSEMLRDLILKTDLQVNIAKKYEYSEAYISQIAKKIKLLKNKPIIENGEIICFKCKKPKKDIVINYNTNTGEYNAIVCHSCNKEIKNNDFCHRINKSNHLEIEIIKKLIPAFLENDLDIDLTDQEFDRIKQIYEEMKKENA